MSWFEEQLKLRREQDEQNFSESLSSIADAVMGKKLRDSWQEEDIAQSAVDEILKFYHCKPLDKKLVEKAIALYRGTLISESSGEHWVVKRAVKYRDMYIIDVYEYVAILKKRGEFEEAERVIENALELVGGNDLLVPEEGILAVTVKSL